MPKKTVRILIGDSDSPAIRKILDLLRRSGCEAYVAGSEKEIIKSLRDHPPDLALISERLLDLDDCSLAGRMKEGLIPIETCLVRLTTKSRRAPNVSESVGLESDDALSLSKSASTAEILSRLSFFLRIHKAEANVRRHTERFELIVKAQQEIASIGPDTKSIMNLAVHRAQELAGADGAVIEMVFSDDLVTEAASGILAHRLSHRRRITTDPTGQCIRTDEVLCCDDVDEDPRFDAESGRESCFRSILIVPLRYQYNAIGVLKVVARRVSAFRVSDEHTLQFVAYFMATSINQAVAFGAKQALLAEHTRTIVALRESEERFRSAFDHASIGMALVRTDGRWLKVNRTLCESVGYSEQEFRTLDFHSLTHPEDLHLHLLHVKELLSGEVGSFQIEERYFHKTGSVLWVLLNVSLLRESNGKPLYFIAQIHDITERKRSEEALVMQARVLQNMSEGVCLADESGLIVYTNRAEDRIFGYQPGELKGNYIGDLIGDPIGESGVIVEEIIRRVKAIGGWHAEFNNWRKDRSQFTTSTSISLLEASNKKYLVCVQEDITEKKLSDAQIQKSLKEKEVLLKEIHHRVKNNLQVISSLLNLQSGYTENRIGLELIRESQNRVRSMALIHEKLYQ